MSAATTESEKRVVILGGGYYGLEMAKKLDSTKGITVTLVDKREVFNHKVGGIRASIAGDVWAERVLIPYSALFKDKKNTVVHQLIDKVTSDSVQLQDGSTLEFDYLVIATGAQNQSPGEVPFNMKTKLEMKQHYETISQKIKAAKNIVIVGAGAVGLEYAGEIKDLYGDMKDVTIVTSETSLFTSGKPPMPAKFCKAVQDRMDEMNVKIIFGDRVTDLNPTSHGMMENITSVKLTSGTEVPADLCIISVGATTKDSVSLFPVEWIDESNGLLNVKDSGTFQITGIENVFAIGDCTNIEETKLAALASSASTVLVTNIKTLVTTGGRGQKPKKIYKPNTMVFSSLPFGETKGVTQLPFGTFGNFVSRMLKAKDLFTSPNFQGVNQVAPKVPTNWKETFMMSTSEEKE